MATWIQSLSWTLIYALGQGFVVYTSLWLVLKLIPAASSNTKYHLSLSALTILLGWFVATWWHQFHILALANAQTIALGAQHTVYFSLPLTGTAIENYSGYRTLLSSVQALSPWLSAFYFAGLLFMLVRLSGGILQLSSLGTKGISQADAALNDLLSRLKKQLHIEGGARLYISAKAQVPMVIGFIKPMILMPAATIAQLSAKQLETILLHELAHIKRHDYLVNILQTIVETILFFNPFVWLISGITRREREHCCDDLVLQHTQDPLFYATALAALASDEENAAPLAVAASGQSNHLFNRIKRIMEMKKNPFSYSRMVAAIVIIATITCSAVLLTPSFARTKKEKSEKTAVSAVKPGQPAAVATQATPTAQPVARAKKDKPAKTGTEVPAATEPAPFDPDKQDANQLVQRLLADRLVDEGMGFVVEKKADKLFIDGKQQPDEVASKYLNGIQQTDLSVHVFSFRERLQMHPGAGIMELIMPVTTSAGCVQYTPPKKPGC